MNERQRIGSRIKEMRESKGLTQLQLAELTGLRQQNIARVEAGKYSTGLDIITKIASAMDCCLDLYESHEN
jgi:transcriptional regulator with XRE-family HTH domain